MTLLRIAGLLLCEFVSFGQGQVWFSNHVPGLIDAPITVAGSDSGPGPAFSVQLVVLAGDGGSPSARPLMPFSTFLPAGMGGKADTDRYWRAGFVDFTGLTAGSQATVMVRAWLTSLGSFEAAEQAATANYRPFGTSAPFKVFVPGDTPASFLVGLQSFSIGPLPEPSVFSLGCLGCVIWVIGRRSR